MWLRLIVLGFPSTHREEFEIVSFLQALGLEGGVSVVLRRVIGSSIAVALVGMIVFRLQKNLPYVKILVITGILIGSVLLQIVGWLPIHVLAGLDLPYWLGT